MPITVSMSTKLSFLKLQLSGLSHSDRVYDPDFSVAAALALMQMLQINPPVFCSIFLGHRQH